MEPNLMKDIQGKETILRETKEDLNKWRKSTMIMNKIDQTIEKIREWRKLVEILYSN